MVDAILNVLRFVRSSLNHLSEMTICGLGVDVPLHFAGGALILAIATRYWHARRAWCILAAIIIAKEIADMLLKSNIQYIQLSRPAIVDSIVDLAAGILGGCAAEFWRRWSARANLVIGP